MLWRWRYELLFLAAIPVGLAVLLARFGWWWGLACVCAVTAVVGNAPSVRDWLRSHARCVVTAHRVRTGCAHAWIQTRYGRLPVVVRTSPAVCGERVVLWCLPGICQADFEAARDILSAACWASDIYVTSSPRYAHIVILYVIRR